MENKETIFYSIIQRGQNATDIIPELDKAYNMTPHRIDKNGDEVIVPIERTLGKVTVLPCCSWIHPEVTMDYIKLTFDPNTTNMERVAKPFIQYCDPSGCKMLLNFRIHQNY